MSRCVVEMSALHERVPPNAPGGTLRRRPPSPVLQSPVQVTPTKLELKMACGVSSTPETVKAAEQACEQCLEGLQASQSAAHSVDTAFLFFSAHHVEHVPQLAAAVLRRLAPTSLIGVSTVAAIGGG